ncbi:DivIVA domain-containing protein [Arthrobacter sp. LAPM80]|uniref:DivIVA domain-containing protein n=1 Tax=Arthrobacter sp. LAPM80 TaxID=3141788 RepID=UPI00398B45EC
MHSTEIARVNFSHTRFREGYRAAEVDTFMENIRQALAFWEAGRPGPLTAEVVDKARFAPIKFRAGYDEHQVDNFLDDVIGTLKAYEAAQQR